MQHIPENPDGFSATVVVEDIFISARKKADHGEHSLGDSRDECTDGCAMPQFKKLKAPAGWGIQAVAAVPRHLPGRNVYQPPRHRI